MIKNFSSYTIILLLMSSFSFLFTFDTLAFVQCGDTAGGGSRIPCECGYEVVTDTILQASDPVVANGPCTGDGLLIAADNIKLDCKNHMISGDDVPPSGDNGILLDVRTGVTVKNCYTTGFFNGITINSGSANKLINNRAETIDCTNQSCDTDSIGFSLRDTNNNKLFGNNFTNNMGTIGFRLLNSSQNTLMWNKVTENINTRFGFLLILSNDNKIYWNRVSNNQIDSDASTLFGISLEEGFNFGNKLIGNIVSFNYGTSGDTNIFGFSELGNSLNNQDNLYKFNISSYNEATGIGGAIGFAGFGVSGNSYIGNIANNNKSPNIPDSSLAIGFILLTAEPPSTTNTISRNIALFNDDFGFGIFGRANDNILKKNFGFGNGDDDCVFGAIIVDGMGTILGPSGTSLIRNNFGFTNECPERDFN